MKYVTKYANAKDIELLSQYDKHISREELEIILKLRRVLMIYNNDTNFVGWLRYNLFWDNTPFMNMLYILDGERGKGIGRELVTYWENEMKRMGYRRVLTSTQSDENAQFFYRKLGYCDRGALLLPDEPLEIIFYKDLR